MKFELCKLLLISFLVTPTQLLAQESPERFMIEAGLVGGSGDACPGHYISVSAEVVGPVSLYGMVENYRCQDLAGSANRIGTSIRFGSSDWVVQPELRSGLEYDGGDLSPTFGASLFLGGRYGARLSIHFGDLFDNPITLFQLGGYIRF